MYSKNLSDDIKKDLEAIQTAGKFKKERDLSGPQGPRVVLGGKEYLMFASNNYLGLANHPRVLEGAKKAIETHGFGLSSVRFISGTQDIHRELEKKIAGFLGTEDAILYSTGFMANLGFFATITNEAFGATEPYVDVIYSDELNHASIIDALKMTRKGLVEKRVYKHSDIDTLRKMLEEDTNKNFRHRIIATDGVFSMEGDCARLPELVALAEEFEALLFVDDAHGVGVIGESGKGSAEETGVQGKIDVLSGTLGKALGGALGGYLAGPKDLIELMRQKSRSYLFSNSLPPAVVGASISALDILAENSELLYSVRVNSDYFREGALELGFDVLEGRHPIVPVMIGDAKLASEASKKLFEKGVYVTALSFPVVPEGEARLRFQVSAAHTRADLDEALLKLKEVGTEMGLI